MRYDCALRGCRFRLGRAPDTRVQRLFGNADTCSPCWRCVQRYGGQIGASKVAGRSRYSASSSAWWPTLAGAHARRWVGSPKTRKPSDQRVWQELGRCRIAGSRGTRADASCGAHCAGSPVVGRCYFRRWAVLSVPAKVARATRERCRVNLQCL